MNLVSAPTHENANEQIARSDFEFNQTMDQMTKQMGLSDRELYQLNRVLTQLEEQQMAVTDKTTEQLHALLKNDTLSNKLMQQLPTQASQVLEEFIQEPNIEQLNELSQPLKELIERQFSTENQKELFHLLGEIKVAEPTVFSIVTAKGRGYIAEEILKRAKDANIPIQEDKSLVEILSQLNINDRIPEELYHVVAEVFAFIYKVDRVQKNK